ncbi:hypothetical protein AB0M54_38135 [Actinoplanes sp. NPDC051470]|uniref:hypothetical protein n=1 Tax=Actinoplanes sp. NPDC051470 TaxID=3157224 RepID=UPI00342A4A1B
MVTDIVYRRLSSPHETRGPSSPHETRGPSTPDEADGKDEARRLLSEAAGYRSPRRTGDEVWSGLWNLTAAAGNALVAVAATARLSPRVVELRAIAAAHPDGYARLLRELADDGRATGAEWLVAADAAGATWLRRAGYDPWLALPIC